MAKQQNSPFKTFLIVILVLLALAVIASFLASDNIRDTHGNVQVIPVKGILVTDTTGFSLQSDYQGSSEVVEKIEEASSNARVRAIVLEIDSPGGSPVASDEIGQAIAAVDKLTVAWIRGTGASGGYWVASNAKHIVANRMSVVGSIGVTGSYLEFSGLLERWNVSYVRLVTGPYKDAGSPFRELRPEEETLFQERLQQIHDFFVEEVATNRGLPKEDVEALSDGFIMLGIDALDHGLIDEVGGKQEVIEYLEEELDTQVNLEFIEEKSSFLQALASMTSIPRFAIGGTPQAWLLS